MTSEWQKKLKNEDPVAALAALSGAARRAKSGEGVEITVLPLDRIRMDGGTQPRAKLNQAIIDSYAEDMRRGDKFPPVVVFYDGENYWLADGFHRSHSTRKVGEPVIETEVHQGTQRDAVLYSLSVNAKHGLQRTNADKQQAVLRMLNDPEWSQWSDREISRQCHVSHSYVAQLREKLTGHKSSDEGLTGHKSSDEGLTGHKSSDERRTYHTKHGTRSAMNTEKIQSANQRRAEQRREQIMLIREQIFVALADGVSKARSDLISTTRASASEFKAAIDALIDEGQVIQFTDQAGDTYYQLARTVLNQGDDDPISEARRRIVEVLAQGPMVPVELRGELKGITSVVYEVARDVLFSDGTLIRDRDVQSGHVIYRLADQQTEALAPEQTASTATSPAALPPHGQFAHLGVDAHSRDHDPEQESAYKLRLQLEQATMDAIDALERLLQIRGIRSLHVLSSQEMAETDDLLRRLLEYVWDEDAGDNPAAYHIRALREKLAIMDETGQPYDAALDEEG